MSVKFGDSNIGAEIGTPSLNANITKPSINVNFNAPSLGASGGNTILRELVNPQFFIGVVETLDAGEDVYCYLTGTKDAPVLNFGIPMGFPGVDGKDGKDGVDGKDGADGTDGVSPEVTISTITGGHSVTITDADHPTGQTFNVMDGVDGQDGQDGQDGVGVPASGTTGQLLAKKSNTDYDTEWVNPPQGTVTDVTVNGSSVVSQGVAAVTVPEPAPSDGATPSSDTKYGSVGTSTQYARKDHRHTSNFPTTGTPADLGTAANGTSAAYAHADHVHNYPEVVHVGASAPSDSNIQVWLDTDEAGMSAVSSVNAKTGTVVLDALDVGATALELLWENASPTSDFAGQTVSLDLSGYDFVKIGLRWSKDNAATNWIDVKVGEACQYTRCDMTTSTTIFVAKRTITATTSGVQFSTATQGSSGSAPATSNSQLIPITIYGIKGVITT